MAQAHIRLGAPVLSQDGKRLGVVNRLILDDHRRRVKAFVVHKLLQAADKIVEVSQCERVTDDGIVLRIGADEAANLPAFVRESFVEVSPEAALQSLYTSLMPGPGTFLAQAPIAGRHTLDEATEGAYPPPIPPEARVTVESNVPAEYDIIGTGTDVLAVDGRKVGTVSEVVVDHQGDVSGFVVRKGFVFRENMDIPIDWVADISDKHIRLKVSAAQVEAGQPQPRLKPAAVPGA